MMVTTTVASGNEINTMINGTGTSTTPPPPDCGYVQDDQNVNEVAMFLTTSSTLLLSSFGFLGNGIVICLLVFCIKRNHFTIYILNLSIADLGVVTGLLAINTYWFVARLPDIQYVDPLKTVFRTFFLVMYSTSQFLLTVISIDRCVSIFFPVWYRYNQSQNFSTIVCVVIWILTIPFLPAHTSLYILSKECDLWFYLFLLNAVLFTPGMAITTVAILVKVCLISPQYKQRKLLTAILLALLFFLLFALPINIIQYLSFVIHKFGNPYFYEYGYICASINSTINPCIYFLVGREKGDRGKEKIQKILENVFKEEDSRETENPGPNPNRKLS